MTGSFVQEAMKCKSDTISWTVTKEQIETIVSALKVHFPKMTYTASVDWDDEEKYRLRCVLKNKLATK
jgi:hypothetical protein